MSQHRRVEDRRPRASCSVGEGGMWGARLGLLLLQLVFAGPASEAQLLPFLCYGSAQGLPENSVSALAQDERGFLWIGASENGVSRFDGRSFVNFTGSGMEVPATVRALCASPEGRLFIGWEHGIRCLRLGGNGADSADTEINLQLRDFDHPVTGLVFRPDGLHVATREGSYLLPRQGGAPAPAPWPRDEALDSAAAVLAPRRILRAVRDRGGRLWAADAEALYHIVDGVAQRIDNTRGYAGNTVTALLVDDEGSLWCGTLRGLYMHVPHRFTQFPEGFCVPKRSGGVWSIAETTRGEQWIGTISGGAVRLRNDAPVEWLDRRRGLPSDAIPRLLETPDGRLLVLTLSGIAVVKGRRVGTQSLGRGVPAEFIVPSKRGGYWISTHRGLLRSSDQAFTTLLPVRGIPSPRVTQIAEDEAGRLWIGTSAGAAVLHPGADSCAIVDALRGIRIAAVFVDRFQHVWFGSVGNGAFVIRNGTAFPERGGVISGSTVYFIAQDEHDRLYFGTNAGVTCADGPDRYSYTTTHGLVNNEMNSGAVLCDSRNRLWFGSIGGMTRLDPQDEYRRFWLETFGPPPRGTSTPERRRIMLAGISVDGQSVHIDSAVDIGAENRFIEVSFLRPSFRNPGQTRFEYTLQSESNVWHPSEDGIVRITGLAPGAHTLVARMSIGEGLWTAPFRIAVLRVSAPWYRRTLFWLTAVAIALLLGWSAHRYRMSHLLRLERTRFRIASDLHDEVGVNLSTISLLASLEARRDPARPPSDDLSAIESLARSTASLTRDIVWAVNPEKDNGGALFDRLSEAAESIAGTGGIRIREDYDERLRRRNFSGACRRELVMICREAISNARKHAGCSEIHLSVATERDAILVEISDNGHGFDASRTFPGFGLGSMRARAERQRWDFEVQSESTGTRIRVRIRA